MAESVKIVGDASGLKVFLDETEIKHVVTYSLHEDARIGVATLTLEVAIMGDLKVQRC